MSLPRPPAAPERTHESVVDSLPSLPPGPARSLGSRAQAYSAQLDAIAKRDHEAGASGVSTSRILSAGADLLVTGLVDELRPLLPEGAQIALVALGGYGRRELSPHSDLDVLLLHAEGLDEAGLQPFAAALSTALWDLKRAVSLTVRTPGATAEAALGDHVLRTALLDARLLLGAPELFDALAGLLRQARSSAAAHAFLDAKIAELKSRRRRFGGSLYVLEPNLKQGEGGLRDLDLLRWLAAHHFHVNRLSALLQLSILSPLEASTLEDARDFLLRARHALHWEKGRKDDRLTFESQEEVAAALGYRGGPHQLPVEQFMRDYYLAAITLRRAADAMVDRCLAGRQRDSGSHRVGGYRVLRGRLLRAGGTPDFEQAPWRILELFRLAETERLAIDDVSRDELVAAIPSLEAHREDPRVTREFKQYLTRPGGRGELLFELHELGVLGAVLPEFGRIYAQHQHDAYHVYTTDVHSLFALQRLLSLRAGDFQEQVPALWRRMRALVDPLPLYLAMLYHDVGKGLGGGHAEKGTALLEAAATRLELTARQREVAAFLVREHLLMSHTSQRRDLSDPALIADFAARCGDHERLVCLTLLTWADMSSVGPGMWTDWRAQLLETLYTRAREVLLGTGPGTASGTAREASRAAWTARFGEACASELVSLLPNRYFDAAPEPSRAVLDARLLLRARRVPLAAVLLQSSDGTSSHLALATHDRPGLLATIAGVLAAHRIDILSARIVTTADGLALDAFDVRAGTGGRLSKSRWREARRALREALDGRLSVPELLSARAPAPRYAKPLPPVATRVTVDNRASGRFSVVDFRAEDRLGLLHDVARALAAEGLEIGVARVNTEANSAVDSFYVTRGGGKLTDAEVERLVPRLTAVLSAPEVGPPEEPRGSPAPSGPSGRPCSTSR